MPISGSRTKRALLIGIDKYPKLTQLEGCVNDVQLMRSVLQETFGFLPENITLLADDQAPRDAILAALDKLVDDTGPGDIVVVHYAGHGSQMTDREGDEPDGLDETIMSFDSEGRWGVNRDITDDEIHLRLAKLGAKTSYITLIFDSCHSGTITRDAFGVRSRSIEPDTRPVSELPPSPLSTADRELLSARESGPSGWMPLAEQYVLLAGCRDEETSYEYRPPEGKGEIVHGALTYFLSEELRRATAGMSYRDLFERAAAKVNAANNSQHPQMEGRADREIFGITDLEPMPFVRVTVRDGAAVTLGRGAAQGMTVGSTWTVYPQGTKTTEGATPLGRVEITSVRAVASDAKVLEEASPGAIVAEARATETVHAYGDLRLKVQVVGPAAFEASLAAFRKELEGSPLLQVVEPEAPASARVYIVPPRAKAADTDDVPQLGAVTTPVWAAVTENGQLMMPPKPLEAVSDVKTNLEKLARYRQALSLENPDPSSALRDGFTLDLLRQGPDKRWIVAAPESAGGQIVFEEGETIAFRITSHYGDPVYVNLLDFGLSGSVSVVYPARGAKEKLTPRMNFEIGTRPGERGFTLKMPKEFPYTADASGGPIQGTETLKLFVTMGEADFSFLSQQGVRSVGGPPSPLMTLWQTASGGATMRDVEVSLPVGGEDWTTVVKSFVLRRRSAAALSPDGQPVQVGEATIRTPGLVGQATAHPWRSPRADAAALTTDDLARTLEAAGVEVRQTVEIGGAEPSGGPTRGGNGGPPEIELQVRDPGPAFGQMVMTTDEQGTLSWHFA
ncbi:MAG: caspase domain-containing protein, partial [Gemmatimonadales bacterium]